jgi:thioredoxin reductase
VSGRRLLVIGAGPTGLAAALGGTRLGWDVTVMEQGEVGSSMRQWGPTKFFSPLSMNLPPGAGAILGSTLPAGDALLTGPEFVESVLVPLVKSDSLAGRIKLGHRVAAIGRSGLNKGDFVRHPIRAERPFRVLVENPAGEQTFEFDAVIDASGTYGQPVSAGVGGVPARGERGAAGRLIRTLGTLDDRFHQLAGRTVLMVGHGHSAANAILRLARLAEEAAETRVLWATRSLNRRPCVEVASDPLPERQKVVFGANQLAMQPPGWLQVERRATVEAIAWGDAGKFRVNVAGSREFLVDEIVALTGYRPDLSILSELTVGIDPATEGSAGLARALSNVTDCLSVPAVAPADLDSGEQGFYLAGAKSYGRGRTFLLQSGYAQLETILNRLTSEAESS